MGGYYIGTNHSLFININQLQIMHKRILITLLGLLFLGGIVGCKEPSKDPKAIGTTTTSLEGITFEVKYPGTEGINLDTRAIHDEPEYTIKKLWMCLFSKKDGTLVKEPIDICDPNNSEIYKLETNTGARYTWTTKAFDEGDVYRFFFIANTEMPEGVTVGTTTLDELKKMTLPKTYADSNPSSKDLLLKDGDNYYLPMSGQGYQDGQELVVTAPGRFVEVQLVRAVARIDIENQLPGFVIKKVALNNTWDKSFVALNADKNHPDEAHGKRDVAPFTEVSATGIAGADQVKPANQLKKAFYLYEGGTTGRTRADRAYVRITADWGDEKDVDYVVPLLGNSRVFPLSIVRNHLYKILVKLNGETGKVEFEFVEEPWTLHQLTEVFNLYDVTGENFIRTSTTSGLLTVYKYTGEEKVCTLQLHDNYTATTKWATPQVEAGAEKWLEASIDKMDSKDATLTIKVKGEFDKIFSKTGGDAIHADYMSKRVTVSTEAGSQYTIEVRLTKKELQK